MYTFACTLHVLCVFSCLDSVFLSTASAAWQFIHLVFHVLTMFQFIFKFFSNLWILQAT